MTQIHRQVSEEKRGSCKHMGIHSGFILYKKVREVYTMNSENKIRNYKSKVVY